MLQDQRTAGLGKLRQGNGSVRERQLSGLAPLTFGAPNLSRQPFARRPSDFYHLGISVAAVDYTIC